MKYLFILILIIINSNVYSTEVEGNSTIIVGDNTTIDKATKLALLNARVNAITQYGVFITVESSLESNEIKKIDNYTEKIHEITSSIVKTINIDIIKVIGSNNVLSIKVKGKYYIDDDEFDNAISEEIKRRTSIADLKSNLEKVSLTVNSKDLEITNLKNLLLELYSKSYYTEKDILSLEEIHKQSIKYTSTNEIKIEGLTSNHILILKQKKNSNKNRKLSLKKELDDLLYYIPDLIKYTISNYELYVDKQDNYFLKIKAELQVIDSRLSSTIERIKYLKKELGDWVPSEMGRSSELNLTIMDNDKSSLSNISYNVQTKIDFKSNTLKVEVNHKIIEKDYIFYIPINGVIVENIDTVKITNSPNRY